MEFNTDFFVENAANRTTDLTQSKILDMSNYFVFPCKWINPINNTNAGLKGSYEIRNHFYQLNKIIKGNESVFLNWNNSTITEGHDEWKNSYTKIIYQKGDAWKVYKENDKGGMDFENQSFGTFGEFTSTYDAETITVKTIKKIGKKEILDFYLIPNPTILSNWFNETKQTEYDPDYDDNDVFYISQYINYYDINGEFVYCEVSFTNIQFNMAESGQTIEQHVYFNSPGAGYPIPKLILNNQGIPIDFDLNEKYLEDKGIRDIQFEVSGNYAFAGIEIWGIPVYKPNGKWDRNDIRYYAPRKLLVEDFKMPIEENFYKVSSAENQMYYTDFDLEATANYQSYNQMRKDLVGDNKLDYQGIIVTNFDGTQATNTLGRIINDNNLVVGTQFPTLFDKLKTEANQWFYNGPLIQAGSVVNGLGIKELDLTQLYKRNGSSTHFKDMFNIMSFVTSTINKLPYEVKQKLTWSVRDIFGFGNFLNKLILGFPFYWRQVYNNTDIIFPELQKVPVLLSKTFYDFVGSSVYASDTLNEKNTSNTYDFVSIINKGGKAGVGKIPLDFFQTEASNNLGAIFGNKATTSTLNFTLTDKCVANLYVKNDSGAITIPHEISTVMLNQTVDPTKTFEDEAFKVDKDFYSLNSSYNGANLITDINGGEYMVTHIGVRGIGDGDIRISAYNYDVDHLPNDLNYLDAMGFQTYVKTQAGYKNNQIREWFTFINTSYLDALKTSNRPYTWPQPMPNPKPDTETLPIEKTISYNIPSGYRQGYHQIGTGRKTVTKTNIPYYLYGSVPELMPTDPEWKTNLNIEFELHDFSDDGLRDKADVLTKYDNIFININTFDFRLEIGYGSGESAANDSTLALISNNQLFPPLDTEKNKEFIMYQKPNYSIKINDIPEVISSDLNRHNMYSILTNPIWNYRFDERLMILNYDIFMGLRFEGSKMYIKFGTDTEYKFEWVWKENDSDNDRANIGNYLNMNNFGTSNNYDNKKYYYTYQEGDYHNYKDLISVTYKVNPKQNQPETKKKAI